MNNDATRAESTGGLLKGAAEDVKFALISFVSRGKSSNAVRVSRSYQALSHLVIHAKGTARSEILSYLGLEVDEKDVIISYIRAEHAQAALQALRRDLEMDKPGHGISFLVPVLSSKGLKAVFRFAEQSDSSDAKEVSTINASLVSDEGILFNEHELILVTLQPDSISTAMHYAHNAGAGGGTVVDVSNTGIKGFMHYKDNEEYKLLLILAEADCSQGIINAIQAGLKKTGLVAAFILSLPVAAAVGINHNLSVNADGTITKGS